MQNRVCGFLFAEGTCRTPNVLMTRRNLPGIGQGMLTGITAAVADGALPVAAMTDACRAVSGLEVADWHLVAELEDPEGLLHVFETWVEQDVFRAARRRGDATLLRLDLADLWWSRVLDEVKLLIPLALDRHSLLRPVRLYRAPAPMAAQPAALLDTAAPAAG